MTHNPVIYTDDNGMFKLGVHQRIISNASANGKISATAKIDLTIGATVRADIVGALGDNHFDGRSSFAEVQKTWNSLNANN